MTTIEQALFLDGSAHWVSAFDLTTEALVLTLHPCQRRDACVRAVFRSPRVIAVDDSYTEGRGELPWDIIGFDSEQLPNGRWEFCLHTDWIEYVFESSWPEITKPA